MWDACYEIHNLRLQYIPLETAKQSCCEEEEASKRRTMVWAIARSENESSTKWLVSKRRANRTGVWRTNGNNVTDILIGFLIFRLMFCRSQSDRAQEAFGCCNSVVILEIWTALGRLKSKIWDNISRKHKVQSVQTSSELEHHRKLLLLELLLELVELVKPERVSKEKFFISKTIEGWPQTVQTTDFEKWLVQKLATSH